MAQLRDALEKAQFAERSYMQVIDNLKADVLKAQKEMEEAKYSASTFATREAQLLADIKLHSDLAKEAQANYERQVLLHGADLQALRVAKETVETLQASLRSAVSERENLENTLKAKEASWEEQKKMLQHQISELDEKLKSMAQQNDILHSQLDQLTSAASKTRSPFEEAVEVEVSEKTIRELREVVQFLRKEKGILEYQLEFQQQESQRYKQKAEHTVKLLDEATSRLREEQEKALQNQRTEAQHKALLERVEQLNLLRESNAMLREENEKNAKALQEWISKANALEASIAPLLQEKKTLAAEKDVLIEEKKSLQAEIAQWKTRVQNLLVKNEQFSIFLL